MFGSPKKKAIKLLRIDLKYDLREFYIVKPMLDEEHKIVKNLHNFAKRRKNIKLLKEMNSQLEKLERKERWQQIRARFPKLKNAMNKLLASPYLGLKAKAEINTIMPKFEIYERDLLRETKIEIEPLIKNKMPNQIDWNRVEKATEKLVLDIQELVFLDQKLQKIIKG